MAEDRSWRGLVPLAAVGGALAAAFGAITVATDGSVDWPVLLAAGASAPVAFVLALPAIEPSGVRWPVAPSKSLGVPQDTTVRVMAKELRGACSGNAIASRDLVVRLADLVAARLVARHGADPADPFAGAPLSPGLRRYVSAADDDRPVPSLSRRTLHAYLKEIDRL